MNSVLQAAIGLAATLRTISSEVTQRHIGRGDVVRATLLSLLSKRPAFFLGSPGVDKTGTIQDLAKRIDGFVFYDVLVPTITSPEQLLVESTSIEEVPTAGGGKEIRTKDTLGRAANAHGFFADEIWKGDERVLQTMIDLSKGDGVRHEGTLVKIPLLVFLAASNELPDRDGKLGAMLSRMTIRVRVNSLDKAGKLKMIASRFAPIASIASAKLTLKDIETLRTARKLVVIPQEIIDAVLEIYQSLLDENSADFQWAWDDDRRFGRVFDVLQASALLAGRAVVTKADLQVLEWMLWETSEQIAIVEAKVRPYCRTPAMDAREQVDALMAAGGLVTLTIAGDRGKGVKAIQQIETCEGELARLKGTADASEFSQFDLFIAEVAAAKADVIAVVTGQKKGGK